MNMLFGETEVVSFEQNNLKLKKQLLKIDLMQSLYAKTKKNSYIKRMHKIYTNLKNQIKQFHYETIKYITQKYDKVYLPSFDSQKMIVNTTSLLKSITKRTLNTLSHYLFKQRLLSKCEGTTCQLEICNEAYTTKTCTACGNLNENIKGNKVYNCSKCSMSLNRDVNGARNIFLKYFCTL